MIPDQSKIESLPLDVQAMLNEYVDFLFQKHNKNFSQKSLQKNGFRTLKEESPLENRQAKPLRK